MLTNDDKTILYELYTEYRHRRSAGMSREKSCDFKSCDAVPVLPALGRLFINYL